MNAVQCTSRRILRRKALTTFNSPPRLWGRYVDDTLAIIKRILLEIITTHIDGIHQSIKFTRECEVEVKIAVLDALIYREHDNSLRFTVFRKATHTDQYLNVGSHQPLQHKLGVIRTLYHRVNTLISKEDKTMRKDQINQVLRCNGYPKWTFKKATKKRNTNRPSRLGITQFIGSVTVPYIHGVSESLRSIYKKRGVTVHFKLVNTI